uniref:Uncharacterized protein n=1 Tax=viral metagenome TaxID=1070528 RepID=A0A6M3K3Q2_9ZZZZ
MRAKREVKEGLYEGTGVFASQEEKTRIISSVPDCFFKLAEADLNGQEWNEVRKFYELIYEVAVSHNLPPLDSQYYGFDFDSGEFMRPAVEKGPDGPLSIVDQIKEQLLKKNGKIFSPYIPGEEESRDLIDAGYMGSMVAFAKMYRISKFGATTTPLEFRVWLKICNAYVKLEKKYEKDFRKIEEIPEPEKTSV